MRKRAVGAKLEATLECFDALKPDVFKALWLQKGEGVTGDRADDDSHQYQCFRLAPEKNSLRQVVPRDGVKTFGAATFGTVAKPHRQAMYNILYVHELRIRRLLYAPPSLPSALAAS